MENLYLLIIMMLSMFTTAPTAEQADCTVAYTDLKREVRVHNMDSDSYFLNGKPFTGCAREEHPDNDQYFIYHIKNGKCTQKVGYYENGQLSQEFNFDKFGLSHGRHVMFYEDGKPYIEEYYEYGQNHGILRRWHNNGQLARDAFFQYGMKVSEQFYDKEGNKVKGQC